MKQFITIDEYTKLRHRIMESWVTASKSLARAKTNKRTIKAANYWEGIVEAYETTYFWLTEEHIRSHTKELVK